MVVTNALGIAFTATLLAASDAGVTFSFPGDGATNTLAWAQLAPCSQSAVCEAAGFAPVPPELAATFRLAEREMRRLEALEADRRIDVAEATRRREAIRTAFSRKCRDRGVSAARTDLLLKRLACACIVQTRYGIIPRHEQ